MFINVNLAKKSTKPALQKAKEYSVNLPKPTKKLRKHKRRIHDKENISENTVSTGINSRLDSCKLSFSDEPSIELPTSSLIDKFLKIEISESLQHDKNTFLNRKHRTPVTHEDSKRLSTALTRQEYEEDIYEEYFFRQMKYKNFLKNHEVTERMRTRMADWCVEVLHNYKCNDQTYFLAISIMDRYFDRSENRILPSQLHGIGVVAMFIATKYNEVNPIRLSVLYDKIAHKKMTPDQLKSLEKQISSVLDYEFLETTSFDFFNLFSETLFSAKANAFLMENAVLLKKYPELKEKPVTLLPLSELKTIRLVAVYLLKMNCHDYKLSQQSPALLGAASLYVALKISEQITNKLYVTDTFTQRLLEISKLEEDDLIKVAQKILYNAQNFEKVFRGLENLRKVHFSAILEVS